MNAAVEVIDLVRRFGPLAAVDGVSFTIPAGRVLGFIGANGAGKTTTMRLMATLDEPTSGSVRVAGYDAVEQPAEVRRRIGWMGDTYGAYPHVTVREYLDFYARAYGLKGSARHRRVTEIMAFTDLNEIAEKEMTVLSKGMAQRLCLGRALVPDPDVLILDEPAAGLDPRARIEFRRLVRLLAEAGKALFISSHILSELEEMCDALLFIDNGHVVHDGPAQDLRRRGIAGVLVRVEVLGDPVAVQEWALRRPGIKPLEATPHGYRLHVVSDDPGVIADHLQALVAAGIRVVEFRKEERRLEDAFVEVLNQVPVD